MQTAVRGLTGAGTTGEPMPAIPELASLSSLGLNLRKGTLVMVAGMPGSQKSGLAEFLVAKWKLPTLYFSADQDQHDTMTRLASIVTGHATHDVAASLRVGEDEYYREALAGLPISFVYDSAPSLDDIQGELDAYVELYDAWPEVIVIDNLINVQLEHDSEWAALRLILTELQALARLTGALVVVLHHMAEYTDPLFPPPRKALHGKVSQRPEVILSLAFVGESNELRVALVKNRGGRADPTGKTWRTLAVQPDRTTFGPPMPAYAGYRTYYQEDQ